MERTRECFEVFCDWPEGTVRDPMGNLVCGKQYENGNGWTIWADRGYGVEEARDDDWISSPSGKIYCPEHPWFHIEEMPDDEGLPDKYLMIDDDDNVTFVVKGTESRHEGE